MSFFFQKNKYFQGLKATSVLNKTNVRMFLICKNILNLHYALKSIAAMSHIGMKESIFLKSEILRHLKGKNSK